ncbi:MAG: response regulator [Oligoflexales bacterium]|nr:response regulator [Oligoflexales bacterium]
MKGLKEDDADLQQLHAEGEELLAELGVGGEDKEEDNSLPCVLILEDDEVSSFMLVKLVKKMGCRVRSYENPLKALKEAESFKVALLFLDMKLPEMNGLEFLTRLREVQKNQDIPVVVVTGYTQKHLVDKILQHKVQGILAKPLKMERAIHFIHSLGGEAKINKEAKA